MAETNIKTQSLRVIVMSVYLLLDCYSIRFLACFNYLMLQVKMFIQNVVDLYQVNGLSRMIKDAMVVK